MILRIVFTISPAALQGGNGVFPSGKKSSEKSDDFFIFLSQKEKSGYIHFVRYASR